MNYIQNRLTQIIENLKIEIACECFFQYIKVGYHNNSILLKIQLPKILNDMDLKEEEVLNGNFYFCTVAFRVDENENILNKYNNRVLNNSEVETLLQDMLTTTVKTFGTITNGEKKFLTTKFLLQDKDAKKTKKIKKVIKPKIISVKELQKCINKEAMTNVQMRGKIDDNGLYYGVLTGEYDELYMFLNVVAKKRGKAFERVDFRLFSNTPKILSCNVRFDTSIFKPSKGFVKSLFNFSK